MTYRINIYHGKSRLNTPVWGSLFARPIINANEYHYLKNEQKLSTNLKKSLWNISTQWPTEAILITWAGASDGTIWCFPTYELIVTFLISTLFQRYELVQLLAAILIIHRYHVNKQWRHLYIYKWKWPKSDPQYSWSNFSSWSGPTVR